MKDPVRVKGTNYERESIIKFLKDNNNNDPFGNYVDTSNLKYLKKSCDIVLNLCFRANKAQP